MSDIPDNLGGNESVRMPDVVVPIKVDTKELDAVEERLRAIKEETEKATTVVVNQGNAESQRRSDAVVTTVSQDKDDQLRATLAQMQNTVENIERLLTELVNIASAAEQRMNG